MADENETSIHRHDKNHKEEETDSREKKICAMTARKQYHLSLADLDEIPCITVRNPYYRSAAPMRLFEVGDVEDYATRKREYNLPESRAARKAEKLRHLHDKTESFVTAGNVMKSRNAKWDIDYVEQLPLSQDVLSGVMETLAASVEPSGVYGPIMAARDLARVALTCKQMYRAHHAGMRRLGIVMVDAARRHLRRSQTTVHRVPTPVSRSAQQGGNSPFDGLVRGRLPPLAEIKEACRELEGCKVTGDKTSLAAGFLTSLDLDHPTNAPLCAVWAARLERDTQDYEKFFGDSFRREMSAFGAAFPFRRRGRGNEDVFDIFRDFFFSRSREFYRASRHALMDKHRVKSYADLDALKARLVSDAERAAAERQKNVTPSFDNGSLGVSSCTRPGCPSIPAMQCVNSMCARCCASVQTGPACKRHRRT